MDSFFFNTRTVYVLVPSSRPNKVAGLDRMIHVKDSLLQMGKVWSLDFLGI